MNQFYKGRTNNHLTFAMVDATDFATPESALSAATKIKIYGKLRGGTGTNFVSSGTGSLTNDITHVGASVLGIYTIALAKADLSDASAAWYDQYVISLSATGAAYQALVVDGGIDASTILAQATQGNSRVLIVQSQASDAYSAIIAPLASMTSDVASAVWAHATGTRVDSRVLLVLSQISDTYSQLSDFRSDLHSFVSTTGVQVNASSLSDLRSAIAAGPAATVTASDISDIASAVWANAIGTRVDSRILVNKSAISDLASYLVVMSGVLSDTYSAVSNINSLAIASPTGSDIASKVWADTPGAAAASRILVILSQVSDVKSAIAGITASVSASDISDIASAVWANTIGARVDSRILVGQSYLSDIRSHVSDLQSDFQSRVPKRVATDSQLSDMASDLKSAIAGITATVSASDMSDIASRVWATTEGTAVSSRVLVMKSTLSDTYSLLSDFQSDFQSRVPKRVATDSQLSDMASDIKSAVSVGNSRILVTQSMASDLQSKLSDVESNLLSYLVTTGVNLNTSVMSDLRSAIAAVTVTLDASAISDIASAVLAGAGTTTLSASDMSDIASRVWATAIAQTLTSRMLVATSGISDSYSLLSDLQSDFQSRVPKRVATDSQLSDLASDVKSAVSVGNSRILITQSMASDAASAAQQGSSRILVTQSMVSDTQSKLSDVESNLLSVIGTTGVQINASSLSDIRSAITAGGGFDASALSDITSAVTAALSSDLSDVLSAARKANSQLLVTQSALSDVQSAVALLPATKLTAHAAAVLTCLTTSGSSTTSVILNATTGIEGGVPSATDDFYNGRVLIFTSGALSGQATSISDYTGSTKTLTVVALTGAPASGVTGVIV